MILLTFLYQNNDYLTKLTISIQSNRLQERTENYIETLECFCNILESIRHDSTICLEDHLPAVIDKSRQIQKLYEDIDKIEKIVSTVKKVVDEMDAKVSEAESVLGKPVIIRRLFGALFGSSPKKTGNNANQQRLQYTAPHLFKSSDFFVESSDPNNSEDLIFSGASASDDPNEEIVVRSQTRKNKKYSTESAN